MTAPAMAELAKGLPLRITSAEWADPTFIVRGDDWSLTLTCPWRLVTSEGIALGWSSPGVEGRGNALMAGREVIDVRPQATSTYADPVLVLTGDILLEIFSETEVDPWVLRTAETTIVGPLTRPSWP